MSLFGGAAKTTTKVRPAKETEALLRKIVSQTENEDLGDYISRQFAEYSPEEQQQIQQMADSGQLNQASAALSPRMLQGLQQQAEVNKQLGDIAGNGITAQEVLANKGALQKGLYSQIQNTAASGGGVAQRLGSGASRAAARRGTSQMQARAAINPSLTNQGINLAQNKRQNQMDYTNLQSGVAGSNIGLGLEGMDLGQQATQNKLGTGNYMQQYQNAMNMNNFQNANSAAQFPWENVNRKLNVLDQVSPMAGYTSTNQGAAPSSANRIASAGLMGLSLYGSTGGFANADSKTQTGWLGTGDNAIPEYKMNNMWNNSAGTGLFNRMGYNNKTGWGG